MHYRSYTISASLVPALLCSHTFSNCASVICAVGYLSHGMLEIRIAIPVMRTMSRQQPLKLCDQARKLFRMLSCCFFSLSTCTICQGHFAALFQTIFSLFCIEIKRGRLESYELPQWQKMRLNWQLCTF